MVLEQAACDWKYPRPTTCWPAGLILDSSARGARSRTGTWWAHGSSRASGLGRGAWPRTAPMPTGLTR
eukprot:681719-Pyramimonas_sp.AAC.1